MASLVPFSHIFEEALPCGLAATGDVRLSRGVRSEDGSSEYGRLEVFDKGGWGSVCESKSTGGQGRDLPRRVSDAAVDLACKQLGYDSGSRTDFGV